MTVEKKRELTDYNLGDETLRLFFLMAKKLNGEFMKDSTIKHLVNISGIQEREVKAILLRFKDYHTVKSTLGDVGEELKLSRERVRQVIAKALRKLRQPSKTEAMKDFLKGEKI